MGDMGFFALAEAHDFLPHPADGDGLLVAARHQQSGARAATLRQRVGTDRGAVHEGGGSRQQFRCRRRQGLSGIIQAIEHAVGWIVGRRQRFGRETPPRLRQDHAVGEGAADIDADSQAFLLCDGVHDASFPQHVEALSIQSRAVGAMDRVGSTNCPRKAECVLRPAFLVGHANPRSRNLDDCSGDIAGCIPVAYNGQLGGKQGG